MGVPAASAGQAARPGGRGNDRDGRGRHRISAGLLATLGESFPPPPEAPGDPGVGGSTTVRLGEFGEAPSPSPAARAMSLLMLVS